MTQQNKTVWWALALPLLAVLIWSMNVAVTRYVVDYISPVSISFYRWFVAFLILTPFMLAKVWRERQLVLQHWKQLAVLGAFGMVLYQGLGYSAAHYTTATNMGIINAFIPVFTIFVAMFMLKDNLCDGAGRFAQPDSVRWASGRCHDGACGIFLCIL